jgi:hypothetical protein
LADTSDSTSDGDEIDDVVAEQVVQAYWKAVSNRPAASRARAQAGFAVASVITAAIIAGAFTRQVQVAPTYTKYLAVAAVAFWLLTAGLFMSAMTRQTPSQELNADELAKAQRRDPNAQNNKPTQLPLKDFTLYAIRIQKEEDWRIKKSILGAQAASAIAIVLTLATVAAALFFSAQAPRRAAEIMVRNSYFQEFASLCQVTPKYPSIHELVGTLDTGSLNDDFITFAVSQGNCVGSGQFEIPRRDVLQIEEFPKCAAANVQAASAKLIPSQAPTRASAALLAKRARQVPVSASAHPARSSTPTTAAPKPTPTRQILVAPAGCPVRFRDLFRRSPPP